MSGASNEGKDDQPATLEQIRKLFGSQARMMEESEARIKEAMCSMKEELTSKIEMVQKENEALRAENNEIKGRLISLEREARKRNIVASGIDFEKPAEGLKQLSGIVEKSTGMKIQLRGLRTVETKTGKKIVAECSTAEEKAIIMSKKRNMTLNNKAVYVDDDLPKEDRSQLFQIRAMAKKLREEGKNVRVARFSLKVDDNWYKLNPSTNELVPTTFRPQGPSAFLEHPRPEM